MSFFDKNPRNHGPPSAKRSRNEYKHDDRGGYMSPEAVERELSNRGDRDRTPGKVLLFTILNVDRPINIEILTKVCNKVISNDGKVVRICIFGRGVVQSMVEFDTVSTSAMVRDALHGADIYSGNCTLKVEFAKTEKLNIKMNDELNWDFTPGFVARYPKDNNEMFGQPTRQRVSILDDDDVKEGGMAGGITPSGMGGGAGFGGMGGRMGGGGLMAGNMRTGMDGMGMRGMGGNTGMGMGHQMQMGGMGMDARNRGGLLGMGGGGSMDMEIGGGSYGGPMGGGPKSSVCMIYGMDPNRMNCQRVFNIFCLYGNVNIIMFLKNKEGCAMIEMGDPVSAERCVHHLHQTVIFDKTLQLDMSRSVRFIESVKVKFTLPDDSPSSKDFSRDRNNRFDTPARAAKNRIISPTKVLHFYSVPQMDDEDLECVFTTQDAPRPSRIKWMASKTENVGLGLLEFDTVEDAVEALVICNHLELEGNSRGDKRQKFDMKLCFSSATW